LEYSARTIRNKINSKLDEFLTEFPPVIKHPYQSRITPENEPSVDIDWTACYASIKCDMNVRKIEWAVPGYKFAVKILENFIKQRLKIYDEHRNDPNKDALSNLSPWYHFGQISVQRAILEIKKYTSKYSKAVENYMEGN
jgi:deoxyribodipyrimidine photo-lyase